jgi:threonine/homoserine/homoserine lactone efflux protein
VAFFNGIGLGLVLATLIGPVFFSLIQTSLKQGFRKAFFMALGITASDTFYILLTYFGIAQFSNHPLFIKTMGLGGGTILIITGLVVMFKKSQEAMIETNGLTNKDRFKLLLKGFSLNFLNPSVLIFWIGAVSAVSLEYDYSSQSIFLFFLGTILTVFGTDLIKISVAKLLSGLLNDKVLHWLNIVAGVLMILFGLKLIIEKMI